MRDTFLVPLSFFRDNPPLLYAYDLVPSPVDDFPYQRVGYQKPYTLRGGRVVVPIYEAYQGYVVWGMTARIVHWLIRELEQPPLPGEGEARR
ncbi:hypothetical protein SDC9_212138 [bioreactor metagenome]|uniref:Nudix hydrolase NudL n=1 Tax=bioreactor metagenome TaxID=1076179 RepID=A0A645JLS6_9ZZZZ